MATGSDPGNVAVDVQAGPAPVPAQLTTAAKGCIGGFALVGVMLLFTDMFLVFMYLWNFAPLYVLLARARSDQNAADRSEIITKFGTGFIVGPFILFTALFIAGSIASFLPDGFAYYFLSCAVIVLIVVAIEEAVKLTS